MKIECNSDKSFYVRILHAVAEFQLQTLAISKSFETNKVSFVTKEGVILSWKGGLKYLGQLRNDTALYGSSLLEFCIIDDIIENFLEDLVSLINSPENLLLKKVFDSLYNNFLLTNQYVAGNRITAADIVIALLLNELYAKNSLLRSKNIDRWYNLVTNNGLIKKYLVSEEICKKENMIPDTIKASTFVIDAWKREYSNSKNLREKSMPWFWNEIDLESWSIWYMRYEKLPEENKVGYVAANMLGGFLQRLEPENRKNSFGVINVLGTEGDYEIQGVWLFEGVKLPKFILDHPSFQYYKFEKLSVPKDKAMIEDYWCNDEFIDNISIYSSKVWK